MKIALGFGGQRLHGRRVRSRRRHVLLRMIRLMRRLLRLSAFNCDRGRLGLGRRGRGRGRDCSAALHFGGRRRLVGSGGRIGGLSDWRRRGASHRCGQIDPLVCLNVVLRHAMADVVHVPEHGLCAGYALALGVHDPEVVLCVGKASLCKRSQKTHRRGVVMRELIEYHRGFTLFPGIGVR